MSQVSSITSTSPATVDALNAQNRAQGGKQTLGINDFMKLLTVQLSSQDPLKPMDDTEFISQMTSFTNLQQTQTLTSDLESFTKQQQLTSANSYLGKTVTVNDASGNAASGAVTAITVSGGAPQLVVNGKAYDLGAITNVATIDPATSNPTSTKGTN